MNEQGGLWASRDAADLGLEPKRALSMLAPVAEAYREPWRYYHNLSHLGEVLDTIHLLRDRCFDLRAVLLAAWFHDAVYLPERRDNEERCADWAARALAAEGFDDAVIEKVRCLIISTKNHSTASGPDAQVLADADRRIWTASKERYAEYARGVRREYGRYSWASYALGRRRFLSRVLRAGAHGKLYFCLNLLNPRADFLARRNLEREARRLAPVRVLLARLRGEDPLDGITSPETAHEPGAPLERG